MFTNGIRLGTVIDAIRARNSPSLPARSRAQTPRLLGALLATDRAAPSFLVSAQTWLRGSVIHSAT